jgi:hypothetical protein
MNSSRKSCGIPARFPLLPTIHHSELLNAKTTNVPAHASTLASAARRLGAGQGLAAPD